MYVNIHAAFKGKVSKNHFVGNILSSVINIKYCQKIRPLQYHKLIEIDGEEI